MSVSPEKGSRSKVPTLLLGGCASEISLTYDLDHHAKPDVIRVADLRSVMIDYAFRSERSLMSLFV